MAAKANGRASQQPQIIPVYNQRDIIVNEIYSITRDALARQVGHSLDPRRNHNQECGFPDRITTPEYREMYDREPIASRVVSLWAEESWAVDPEVFDNEDPAAETEFEKAWKDLVEEHNLLYYLSSIDELCGIGQFGVMLLGINDGQELNKPVKGIDENGEGEGNNSYELLFVRNFDESLVDITKFNNDPKSKRYGQPTEYQIKMMDPRLHNLRTTPPDVKPVDVHWTRIIHVADNCKSSEVLGMPRQQQVYNNLLNCRKILGGSGEMFWKGGFPGLSIEQFPELAKEGVSIDAESARPQIEKYQNNLQRYMALQGLTVKSLAPQIADPGPHLQAQINAICIKIGCPVRIFLGSERGELASSQDQKAWNSRVMRRQNKTVFPRMVKPLVKRLQLLGILPMVEKVLCDWPNLNELSDAEKAAVALQRTQAMAAFITGMVNQMMAEEDFYVNELGYTKEEAEAMLENADAAIERQIEREALQHEGRVEAGLELDIEDELEIQSQQMEQQTESKIKVEKEKAKLKPKPVKKGPKAAKK